MFAVTVLDDVGIDTLLDEAVGAVATVAVAGCLLMIGVVTEVLEVVGLDDDDDNDVCLIVFDDEGTVESSLNNGFFFI